MRNLKNICKNFKEAEIYFHQDLDGVATAILMRERLKRHGVITADAHCIQYGDREWSIPRPKEGRLLVLVDFAHGKTMFHIHTDHHDRQVGVATKHTKFVAARSNAETLDNDPWQFFPSLDMEIIRTVDSANFLQHNIHPHQLRNFVIKNKIVEDAEQNRWTMGLACNKLLLTYKNRLSFLKLIVLNASPSLLSIYIHALKLRQNFGFPSLEETQENSNLYRNRMKKFPELRYDSKNKIIQQVGGGLLFAPGSYDRYIVFENHPLAEYLIMIWPMGLVQASCNPFKQQRLKDINLGVIANDVLEKHKLILEDILINLDDIKFENEKRIVKERRRSIKQGVTPKDRIGFHTNDLLAVYKNNLLIQKDDKTIKYDPDTHKNFINKLRPIIDKREHELSYNEREILKKIHISAYDLIKNNSGGHASITNLSSFNYLHWNTRKMQQHYQTSSFLTIMVSVAQDINQRLCEEIKLAKDKEKNDLGDYWSLYAAV